VSTDYRQVSRDRWDRSSSGWGARRAQVQQTAVQVSQRMLEAVAPQPGQTILELAAGPADTGLMAAELVRPGGSLICTDFSEGMLGQARARAEELGLDNVEFRELDAESLDLQTASVDAVLCRWGYMLMSDPGAALLETRRVLRPSGRVALAVWAGPAENTWASAPTEELVAHGLAEVPDREGPGMFHFAAPGRLEEALADAGFTEVVVEDLAFAWPYESFEHWFETTNDMSVVFAETVRAAPPDVIADVRAALEARFAPHLREDGSLAIPARTLVAAATA
jgi:SAM-dependent methyltransferase